MQDDAPASPVDELACYNFARAFVSGLESRAELTLIIRAMDGLDDTPRAAQCLEQQLQSNLTAFPNCGSLTGGLRRSSVLPIALTRFCVVAMGCLVSFVFLLVNASAAGAQTREFDQPTGPNVLLFLIDDLGYTDLGCYGSTFYRTPNIDALAKRSARFTNFYSANPVCSPTRAALMTGKAPQRVGITQWLNQDASQHLPADEVTLGEAFKSAGYQTGYIGKWHLGHQDDQQPNAHGFDWVRAVNRGGQPASYFFPFKRAGRADDQPPYHLDVPDLADGEPEDYLTDRLTDKAIEFISAASEERDRPFFLCFSHYAVHTPIEAPPMLQAAFQSQRDKLPKLTEAAQFTEERNGSRSRNRQDDPAYAAMVANLDENIGRLLNHLKQLQLEQDTIIVFTSDNGGLSTLQRNRVGPTSCRPLRAGKGWTYEGGIRIPTLIAWPDKISPQESAVLAITMDVYPTLLQLAGLPSAEEQHLDGLSLVPALQNTGHELQDGQAEQNETVQNKAAANASQLANRFLAWTYPHAHGSGHRPSAAIRTGQWKLVHRTDEATPNEARYELYDLSVDPSEQHNLAVERHEKTHELAKTLAEWIAATTPKAK